MAEVTMRICQEDHTWQVQLIPDGTIIGRSEQCDIVIYSPHVSRQHAKIFLTPKGKWFVEDLGSSNGTIVNGKRVESCQLSLADVIDIGPASLSFSTLNEQKTKVTLEKNPNIIIEDFGTEVFYDKPQLANCEHRPCPERLEQVSRRLSELTDMETLYPEVCRLLSQEPKTAAAVFRVPKVTSSCPVAPEVVACHFGSHPEDARSAADRDWFPSYIAFRVSHRLLEAVRKHGRPLMSKSIYSCDTEITLSLIDEHSPRALMCASLGTTDKMLYLLYVDVLIDEKRQPGTEETFAFIQAVAQLIAQRNNPQDQ